ncbi:MAG: hypothetical protein ACKVT1_01275 [Dehalococcoidia bacterium]
MTDERIDKIADDVAFMRGQQSQYLPELNALLEKHDHAIDGLTKRVDAHESTHAVAQSFWRGVSRTSTLAITGIAATAATVGRYAIEQGIDIFTNAK